MAHALALGRRGLGQVWPWPSVGCVIVKDDRVVGRGTTDRAETYRHAEIVALAQAGAAAKGATAYVTLEPCAHHGTTPPCADALIAAGVSRVVAALEDPNPQVAGQGIARLQAAGIEVSVGVRAEAARDQHRGFFSVIQRARPMVTLKLALTLDGRIATATGESQWITGPEARRVVHAMRLSHDAVLVGGGTARADNPTLTVRDMGAVRQPVRVVASRALNLPWPSRLAETMGDGPVWLVHGADQVGPETAARWTDAGAELVSAPIRNAEIDPAGLVEALAKKGVTRVFCEGGGSLAASLLQAGLVDDLVVFSAGLAFGADATPAIAAMGVRQLSSAPGFALVDQRRIGADVMHRWRYNALVD